MQMSSVTNFCFLWHGKFNYGEIKLLRWHYYAPKAFSCIATDKKELMGLFAKF